MKFASRIAFVLFILSVVGLALTSVWLVFEGGPWSSFILIFPLAAMSATFCTWMILRGLVKRGEKGRDGRVTSQETADFWATQRMLEISVVWILLGTHAYFVDDADALFSMFLAFPILFLVFLVLFGLGHMRLGKLHRYISLALWTFYGFYGLLFLIAPIIEMYLNQ